MKGQRLLLARIYCKLHEKWQSLAKVSTGTCLVLFLQNPARFQNIMMENKAEDFILAKLDSHIWSPILNFSKGRW